MGDFDTDELIRSLIVVWPEWMSKVHKATNAIIDNHYKKILQSEFADMHISRELVFEDIAYRRSLERIKADVRQFKYMDKFEMRERIRKVIRRERYYAKLRVDALVKRLDGITEYIKLRSQDPRSDFQGGALWVIDPTKQTHTDDCVAMAGRVWSWNVLRLVNPANRHPGCGCHLEPDPSLVHGVTGQTAPIGILPPVVDISWDMGPISPRPMTDVQFRPPSYRDLYRSQF
jgi:hypothetical protein